MAKWNSYPHLTAAQLAGADQVPVSDASEAETEKSKTTTLDELRVFLGVGITVAVTQASHGLSVGDAVRFDGSDYVLATADTAGNSEAVGVVTLVDGDAFAYQTAGVVSTLSGLTPGSLYYLQDDGSLGTSAGTVEKPILIATSATSAVLILAISGAGGGGGATDFTDLGDVPSSYSGHGGKVVAVKGGEDGLEFITVGGGSTVDINAQTGTTYTLVLGDAGKLVTLTNANPITLTVPTNANVAYPTGTVIALAQLGAGLVTIEGDTGVTINGTTPGDDDLAGQWATAALTKLDANTWLLSGGLA